ncbi:MAG: hypothetical protein IPL67_10590 [Ignavibacteria bacterium]|nr:hypothetical protein [Ignavibacteria bacterium]
MVRADGDNMGSFVELLYSQKEGSILLDKFSSKLNEYSYRAIQLVKSFGGVPVYAGGDDLLYFMPVSSRAGDNPFSGNTFTLIDELDLLFKKVVLTETSINNVIESNFNDANFRKPSISYGVSISYYKFPLNQALAEGNDLLFSEAKSGEKDVVAFSVLKAQRETIWYGLQ